MSASTYRKYLLTILLIVLAFNFVDRLALGLVLQNIKTDLKLSDTQLGFLTGFAFAAFYSVMGIPIARRADRGNRVKIIALTAALWSVMVALCGAATNFLQLLLVRIGVAVGEAGAIPPANSLIADYFDRSERPRAMGVYLLGTPLSALIGYFAAGWLNELFGWRVMFVILGLPGVALAALVWCTLREPRRRPAWENGSPESKAAAAERPSMWEVFTTLWAIPTFRTLLLVFSVLFFFNSGITQWLPTFFIRSHGLRTGEIGTMFTLILGISGMVGIYCGGALASSYAANNERLQLRVLAMMLFFMMLLRPISFLVSSTFSAFALLIPITFLIHTADGPLFAVVQTLVPSRMRAMAIALIYLFGNLIGLGLGPLTVGALSDAYRPWAGNESLRYALITLCPGYLWAIWQLWRASTTITRDLELGRRADRTPATESSAVEASH